MGPGSDKKERVPWRVELSEGNVKKLVSMNFIDSDAWIENQPERNQTLFLSSYFQD